MEKDFISKEQVKTRQDVKKFLQQFIERRKAWEDCIRSGRPLSELNVRGIKVAKMSSMKYKVDG